ncbi:MAG: SDR family oxidoreductase [Lentisphaeria bacterium]|nr:SDR family oxidoreductase [Lentisphaeria bacterium]
MNIFSPGAFAGKRLLLTGGSSGIGAVVAEQAASLGMRVAFCGRNAEAGAGVAARCAGRGRFIRCDLTDPREITRFVEEAVDFLGGAADYLVNAAATDKRLTFDEVTPEAFSSFIDADLRPAVLVTRAALDALRKGDGKSIVNFGTTNWMLGLAPFTLYGAAKSGLLGFTRSLARELGREMIRVNMLSPGWIMTEKQLKLYVTEQDKKDLLRDQALPFLLTADEIVPPLFFLLSEGARGVTGQNLIIDGGKLME